MANPDPATEQPGGGSWHDDEGDGIPDSGVNTHPPPDNYERCQRFAERAIFAAARSQVRLSKFGPCLFEQIAERGITLSTDYSGMGCAEMSAHMIRDRIPMVPIKHHKGSEVMSLLRGPHPQGGGSMTDFVPLGFGCLYHRGCCIRKQHKGFLAFSNIMAGANQFTNTLVPTFSIRLLEKD